MLRLSLFSMIIVCHTEARDPEFMGKLCANSPSREVYALPWVETPEELEANTKTNGGKPNRMWPCEENHELMADESVEMDEKLPGDAFGRMAHIVAHGGIAINEVMTTRGWSPFYGMMLGCGGSRCFAVNGDTVDYYFPQAPLSAKMYAATTVPVMFENTELFADASGCKDETVAVMVSSEYMPGLPTFMRFWKITSGRDMVCLIEPKSLRPSKSVPLFRYNKGYMMNAEDFMRKFHAD